MWNLDCVALEWTSSNRKFFLLLRQFCSEFRERLRLKTCWTQGRSTHYWLVQVNFLEVHSKALCFSFPKIYSFVYPGCKTNSLRCAPCTVVTPKTPFLGESCLSLFNWESHHRSPQEVTFSQSAMPGPYTVPSAAWISSSRPFFTLLFFFLAFFLFSTAL